MAKRPPSDELSAIEVIIEALGLQYIEGSVDDAAPAVGDFDTDLTEATNEHYNGMLLWFVDGVCISQAHVIDDYVGATKNCVFSAEDQWTDAPADGDNFVILPAIGTIAKAIYARLGAPAGASVSADIAAIQADMDVQEGVIGIVHDQVDAAVSINAVNTGETDVLHLNAASTRYIVRSLRLKCADPGANTVTVRLYELINDVLTEVDSYDIDSTNYTYYHSLMDMFGLPQLAGDELQVTVRASAGGPYAVTGQYSHAKTNN